MRPWEEHVDSTFAIQATANPLSAGPPPGPPRRRPPCAHWRQNLNLERSALKCCNETERKLLKMHPSNYTNLDDKEQRCYLFYCWTESVCNIEQGAQGLTHCRGSAANRAPGPHPTHIKSLSLRQQNLIRSKPSVYSDRIFFPGRRKFHNFI